MAVLNDPRWDWIEVTAIGDREPQYVRGRCRHAGIVPVESVTGEIVASLCTDCDAQLPPTYDPGDPGRIAIGRVWR